MKKIKSFLLGIIIGLINVLFGAGGGTVAVLVLRKLGLTQKQAQQNAIAVILPLTVISLIIYFNKGYVNLVSNIFLFPTGILGAFIGSKLLKRLSSNTAKIIFSLFMIWAGIRLIMKG